MRTILLVLLIGLTATTYGQIGNYDYLRVKDSLKLGDSIVTEMYSGIIVNKAYVDAINADSANYADTSEFALTSDTANFALNVENALGNFTVADTLGVGVVSGEAGGGFEWVVVEEFPCNSLDEFADSQSATVSGGVLTVNTEGGVDLISASNTPEKMAMITANDSVRVYFNIVSCGTGFVFGYGDGNFNFQDIDVSTCSTGVYVRNFRVGAIDPILISITGDVVQIDSIAIEVYKEVAPTITLLHPAYIGSVADSNKLITQAELDVATVDSARAAATAEGSQGNFTANGDVTADNLTSLGNITATWNIEGDNIQALTAVETPELRMNGDTAVGIAGSSELDVLFRSIQVSDTTNGVLAYSPAIKAHRIASQTPPSADVWHTVTFDTTIAIETTPGYRVVNDTTIVADFKGISCISGCFHWDWTGAAGTDVGLYVRVLVNGDEKRCLQSEDRRTSATGDEGNLQYKGSASHEIGDIIKVQYRVTDVGLILQGNAIFDKPTAITFTANKISDKW